MAMIEPAQIPLAGIPAPLIAGVVLATSLGLFAYIMYKRIGLLRVGLPDPRVDRIGERIKMMLLYGFGQLRQPRYLGAGIMHILLFAGFVLLSLRSLTLIGRGFAADFHLPLMGGSAGFAYEVIKDYVVLVVLVVCVVAIVRRAVFKPERYSHPGVEGHEGEAYIILGMVSALMLTDMIYDGAGLIGRGEPLQPGLFPAASLGAALLSGIGASTAQALHVLGYWAHILVFFSLLNFLPISKHFHVITAIPNVFFAKLDRGAIKPVRHDVKEWMDLPEGQIGAGTFQGFTWKHLLDFVSCADCGRCSDNCPANAVGRALSPKMISIKARDYAYEHYPVFGSPVQVNDKKFAGDIVTEQEIWACTTCGACERECPIFIEYIDKIVDMRRYLLDQGEIPQSLQKPLQQIKKKGNAYGGAKNKRAAWTKDLDGIEVRELEPGDSCEYLFFVDSCGSFDPRIQQISRSFARIMHKAGADFGILGKDESDSGNEVRRIGEEGLFEQIAEKNIEVLQERTFKEIVAFDPHAFNAIRNDYPVTFPVLHASQLMARFLAAGKIKLGGDYLQGRTVTYHDPCYLGRHNSLYDEPRGVLNRIPGMRLKEMTRSRSRSFCCSGGGLLLWYENEEEKERMGVRRIRMAEEVGAQVVVTACPFCLINLEDAIKVTGNEGKIEVIDLVELVDRSLI
ncbi:MAG: (Fe-S)-binding protein [Thermodesulfobacteriota bacterium]